MVCPDGAPLASGLVEKLYCVLATQIGELAEAFLLELGEAVAHGSCRR